MAKDKKIPANLVFTKEKFKYDTIEELKQDVGLIIGQVVEVHGDTTADDGQYKKMIISLRNDGRGIQLNNKLWANPLLSIATTADIISIFQL